jgi:hypothetical protein
LKFWIRILQKGRIRIPAGTFPPVHSCWLGGGAGEQVSLNNKIHSMCMKEISMEHVSDLTRLQQDGSYFVKGLSDQIRYA